MKKIIIFLLVGILSENANAQIAAYFSHCAFNTPDNKPYVETYISVFGNSVSFKANENGKYQGVVEVGILFIKNGVIKTSRKYNLLSPEINDTLHRQNFIDQQRFSLDTGKYEFELSVSDKNINGKKFSAKDNIQLDFPASAVSMSDVQLLASFTKAEKQGSLTKNGFDLVPCVSNFFPENTNEFSFYAEVYNTKTIFGENEKFLISYYIQSHENGKSLSKYIAFKRETSSAVAVILSKFNIADLPSGNYDLVIEVKNKDNKLVVRKNSFFQRKNPKVKIDEGDLSNIAVENTFVSKIHGRDTLAEFIRSLRPIASQSEKRFADNQLKLADEKLMQQFFYNFWNDRNPMFPENAWNAYLQTVKAVNKEFGTQIRKGYETDRGRVYLQYGSPDKRDEVPSEPNAYPYEIWTYYKLIDKSQLNPVQTNREFIFYDLNLAMNDYLLLHSNALSETYEPNWEMKLHKRATQSNDFDRVTAPEHFGGNANEEFNHPK
ncbi:MAG: GWxTD domain-containing protein [Bacteroidetes bacterium]|nr:GWxTD domain-containing protein [Bacteroidota bacterium]